MHSLWAPRHETDARVAQLAQLLDGEYSSFFSRVFVIDCRFDYEYQGGHIKDALHQDTDAQVLDFFFREQKPLFDQRTAIVFHCEFSSKRGPSRCVPVPFRWLLAAIAMANQPSTTIPQRERHAHAILWVVV